MQRDYGRALQGRGTAGTKAWGEMSLPHKILYLWSSWCQDGDNDSGKVIKAMATLPEHLHTRHCARYLTHTTQVLTIEDREAGLLAPSDRGGAQGADRSAKHLRVTQLVRVEQDLGPGRQAPHPALSTIVLSHLPLQKQC